MQTDTTEKLQLLEESIQTYVRPDTFPLAIRVMKENETLPERVKQPFTDFGKTFSICQAVTMARRYGWALAMGNKDLSCPIAKVAFGFEKELDYYTEGNLTDGMYTKTCDAGALTEAAVPKFAQNEAGTVLIAPLNRTSYQPEVITVYGNSAQVMRMVAGALYHTGGEITSTFTARADCADIVIKTIQTNKPQVILPCYGDRVFGQTHDHEMAFAIPFSMADNFMEGLQQTHKGGVRYPIPTYLQYEATYPETYEKLNDMFDR
ncbi:DUF169 domain-containing protein [Cytobacillus purgationiresistens]|uniref:Uncharacterized protein (DUF169 family) n=1 Tax=Cytobacillus purgationiresistens TaxID=863449 RepID=A0ABU0ALZ9_9BACI|nr:DUF169 domain-containing protein [Cytobacillus purgationiresistens]MDQ0272294.1 uncharacterized protein (DUF169 family) [Cytobacillus purgationiresistens]